MDIKNYISSGIIELYVMGLCTPEEEKELEQYRTTYPELDKAITDYEQEMEQQALQNPTLPSASVDNKILATLQSLNQTKQTGTKKINTPVRKINFLRLAAAAAVLLLITSAYFNYTQYKKNNELNALTNATNDSPLPMADYRIMTDPAITPVALYGVGTHTICRCTMYWDKKNKKAYLLIHHLADKTGNKKYQLWAFVDGKPVNIGEVDDTVRGRFIEMPGIPSEAVSFSVTLENENTSTPTEANTFLRGSI